MVYNPNSEVQEQVTRLMAYILITLFTQRLHKRLPMVVMDKPGDKHPDGPEQYLVKADLVEEVLLVPAPPVVAVAAGWFAIEVFVARPLSDLEAAARGFARGEEIEDPPALRSARNSAKSCVISRRAWRSRRSLQPIATR